MVRLVSPIVDQNGSIKSDNVKATYNGSEWTTSEVVNYSPTYQYYAYYPYSTSGLANLGSSSSKGSLSSNAYNAPDAVTGTQAADGAQASTRAVSANTSASDFFASGISAFTPNADQSTAANFNASDLQVAKATISRTTADDITFDLSHSMGLAAITLETREHILSETTTYNGNTGAVTSGPSTITFKTITASSQFSGNTPRNYADKKYMALVNPSTGAVFNSASDVDGYWNAAINAKPAANAIATYSAYPASGNLVWEFAYIGSQVTYTTPYAGTYAIELYGAEGGDDSGSKGRGGYGGRIYASKVLDEGTVLYVAVGEKGRTRFWNDKTRTFGGGGYTGGSGGACSGTGGGSTDVRYGGTEIANRILVAGGGGGTSSNYIGLDGGAADSGNNGTLFYGSNAEVDGGGGGGGYYGGTSGADTGIQAHGGSNYISSDWTTVYNGTSENTSDGSCTITYIP